MSNNSLNILVLATTFPRWDGDSVPQFVYELSREYQSDKMNVTVLCPHHPGAKRTEYMDGLEVYRYPYFVPYRYQKLAFQGGILPTVRNSLAALLQVPFLFLSLLVHTIWILIRQDIDIIHSHWIVPNGLVGSFTNSVFNIPHVMTLHAGGIRGLRSVPMNSYVASFVFGRTAAVLPVSKEVRNRFIKVIDTDVKDLDGIHVQPMGTHIQNFDTYRKKSIREKSGLGSEIVGLFVGRIAEGKGLTHLLDASSRVQAEHNHFRLIVVGAGPAEEEIRSYAKELDLGDCVEFTGWLNGKELHEKFVLADFLIVPSTVSEGMPTVVTEGLASENPIIASNVGGIPEIVDDGRNGFLVHKGRQNELADAMANLIEKPELLDKMAKEAAKDARDLDWSECGKRYSQVLMSLAEDKQTSHSEVTHRDV